METQEQLELELNQINPEEYTFKDAVLKLYELMGLGSITMEYDELPGLDVTLTIDEKETV